ncbi:unnamed protein product [Discosporangium mesarthrocarpum]
MVRGRGYPACVFFIWFGHFVIPQAGATLCEFVVARHTREELNLPIHPVTGLSLLKNDWSCTMEGTPAEGREVNLSVLSFEQLNQMKTQHEEEVQTLTSNFIKLRDAQARFQESISAVETMGPGAEGKEILVPLTQSLYAPGKVVEANKMMVDIGTGYFVEKDQTQTKEFLQRKVEIVATNMGSVRDAIDMKRKNLDTIVMVMRQKIAQIETRRAEFRAGEGAGVAPGVGDSSS